MNLIQQNIYSYLVEGILGKQIQVNDSLKTEIELGRLFKTSRINAHIAIKRLEKKGIVTRNKRGGTVLVRKPDAALKRELKSEANRRICIITHMPSQYKHIHWNERTIEGLENEVQKEAIGLFYKDSANLASRKDLESFMAGITQEGCCGIVLMLIGSDAESRVFIENQDILYRYHKNIFIFQPDTCNTAAEWIFDTVTINNFGEGVMVAEHLFTKDFCNAAFCSPDDATPNWKTERQKGLHFGLLRASDGKFVPEIWNGLKEIYENLKKSPLKWALVANNDNFAAQTIEFLSKKGLKRGENYYVVSFDDDSYFRELRLTTVSPPLEAVGTELGKLIVEKVSLKGKTSRISHIKIESKIIDRD